MAIKSRFSGQHVNDSKLVSPTSVWTQPGNVEMSGVARTFFKKLPIVFSHKSPKWRSTVKIGYRQCNKTFADIQATAVSELCHRSISVRRGADFCAEGVLICFFFTLPLPVEFAVKKLKNEFRHFQNSKNT